MAPLSEGSRTAIKELVDASPPLTDTQREKLRLLFRAPISPPAKNESTPQVEDAGGGPTRRRRAVKLVEAASGKRGLPMSQTRLPGTEWKLFGRNHRKPFRRQRSGRRR